MPRAHMMKDTLGGGHEDQSATLEKLLKPIHHHSRMELEKAGYVENEHGDWHKPGEEPEEHEERELGDREQNERDLIEHHAHDHDDYSETEDGRIARERREPPNGDEFGIGRHVSFEAETHEGGKDRLHGVIKEVKDGGHFIVEATQGLFHLHRDEISPAAAPDEQDPSHQGLMHSPQPSNEDMIKAEAERAANFKGKPFQGQDQLGITGQKSLLQEQDERLGTAHESEACAVAEKDRLAAQGMDHEAMHHDEAAEDEGEEEHVGERQPPSPTPEPAEPGRAGIRK